MRWEYRHIARTTMGWDQFVEDLNRLGASGWELVNFAIGDATLGPNQLTAVLKRQAPGEPDPDPTLEDEQLAHPGRYFA